MPFLRDKTQNNRIIIKAGIRAFQPYEPVEGVSNALSFEYRECRALVDTGALRTCIGQRIVHELGLERKGWADIWNVKRPERHWTYMFHVAIWPDTDDPYTPSAPFGIGREIEGIDVGNHPYFDVLLGMDIIGQGSLHLERDGSFELAFPD